MDDSKARIDALEDDSKTPAHAGHEVGPRSSLSSPQVVSAYVNLTSWQAAKTFKRAIMLCFFAGVCILMEGYQQTTVGSIVSNPGFINQFGAVSPSTGQKALDASFVSAWGGTGTAFAIVGNQLNSLIADKFGRRIAFFAAIIAGIGGILTESFVTTSAGWLGGKILAGLAWGMGQTATLTYIPEIAPTQCRGALLCCYALFLALGQLSSAIALLVISRTRPNDWRRAIYSEWVLAGLFIILFPFLVESPWFYARQGQDEKAKAVLKKLNSSVNGYDVDREYAVIRAEVDHEQATKQNSTGIAYKEIFMGTNLKRTLGGFFGLIMTQWSGASVVISYATYFMQQVGMHDPFQASAIVSGLFISVLLVSFYTTEKFGRRRVLFTGGIGCFVCNVVLGSLGVIKRTDPVLNAILAIIYIWVVFYAGCLGGVCWGFATEVATPRLRARTAAVVTTMSNCFSLIFGYTVPLMLSGTGAGARNWGVKTMYLFACLGGIGLVINYFLLPELRGRTFAEIDDMYDKGIPPRRMKQYASEVETSGGKHHV